MRKEKQVLEQLLSYAGEQRGVRAVLQNGSRVNPNVKKDPFCDYDIIYIVEEPESFLHDREWIGTFGELLMLQQNTIREHGSVWYIFLMLFQDGVRIDLSFMTLSDYRGLPRDSLTMILLDKDSVLPPVPEPSEESYYTARPTREQFESALNDLFWCSTNVAKGLWRKELPYAKYMLDVVVRENLLRLLTWYAGSEGHWKVNAGKAGKWLESLLPASLWEPFVRTYAGADYGQIWDALLDTCRLARTVGMELAGRLGYPYPMEDDERVIAYLLRVRRLPPYSG